jgi:hypothetical protein
MSCASAAPAHFPYRHRTVEQVDRDHERDRNRSRELRRSRREGRAKLSAV